MTSQVIQYRNPIAKHSMTVITVYGILLEKCSGLNVINHPADGMRGCMHLPEDCKHECYLYKQALSALRRMHNVRDVFFLSLGGGEVRIVSSAQIMGLGRLVPREIDPIILLS